MQVSFMPILLLRMGSLLEVLEIKELGQRQAGVPHRRSLTFLPQAEEQVNSNRKKKKKKKTPWESFGWVQNCGQLQPLFMGVVFPSPRR